MLRVQSNWKSHPLLVRMQKPDRFKKKKIKRVFTRWLNQANPSSLSYDNLCSHKSLHTNVYMFFTYNLQNETGAS